MKNFILSIIVLMFSFVNTYSQINSIGHRTITFNDATRTGGFGSGGGAGRQIQTEIYYPSSAATDGDTTMIASGQYPIIIFGHGFVMGWSSYDNIWKDLVPQGYILCFPRTEGGASPSHADFGKDMALIQTKMLALNTLSTSPLFNTMTNKAAIMGHSMGGGAAFLACSGNVAPTTMVTFAAANTNPSSINAALQVTIPVLVIAGQNDCVAPPSTNQDSMYVKSASTDKAEIKIKGAGHCGFANTNAACMFGQGTCSPQPTISDVQQKTISSIYYSYWLKYWLKNDCQSWNSFLDSVNTATNIVKQITTTVNCSSSGFGKYENLNELKISPNPTHGLLTISLKNQEALIIEVYDVIGSKIRTFSLSNSNQTTIDVSELTNGIYFISVKNKIKNIKTIKFVKD
jgi:pimeloyl-ACP methyl ester carboxylesterase